VVPDQLLKHRHYANNLVVSVNAWFDNYSRTISGGVAK